ncbi:MAG: ABC transporter ATP-binding protein, partial [Phormidesmis sp.]
IKPVSEFWALREVSFDVAAGEMLGVIGHNGAGKSTLLQILGKVAYPNEGRIKMRGRVGALLDLGAGFHGDLTGRENVFVTAIVAGLLRWEVAERFDRIVAFAELKDFIDNPVRTYSSGMMMRLAFAVAIHTEPDILLVDEFLSVGDLAFQSKCLDQISDMKAQGCAIVLVSHDVDQVKQVCDRALWLKQGRVVGYGEPASVAQQYKNDMQTQTQLRTPKIPPKLASSGIEMRANHNRFGSLEAEIIAVNLSPASQINSGEPLQVEIVYQTAQTIPNPIFNLCISRESDGENCVDINTEMAELHIPFIQGAGSIELLLDHLDLVKGKYFVNVGIFESSWSYAYDFHSSVYPLTVESSLVTQGILSLPYRWKMNR